MKTRISVPLLIAALALVAIIAMRIFGQQQIYAFDILNTNTFAAFIC